MLLLLSTQECPYLVALKVLLESGTLTGGLNRPSLAVDNAYGIPKYASIGCFSPVVRIVPVNVPCGIVKEGISLQTVSQRSKLEVVAQVNLVGAAIPLLATKMNKGSNARSNITRSHVSEGTDLINYHMLKQAFEEFPAV